jgi:DnaK suppressor protein
MTELTTVKATLEQKFRQLSKRAASINDEAHQLGDDDWTEHAIEVAGDEVQVEVEDATLEEIAQIKLALQQIEAGTYGVCSECNHAIAPGRLGALPYATLCVKCA